MIHVQEKIAYKAFGLSILSEIPLPELSEIDSSKNLIDIEISIENSNKLIEEFSLFQKKLVVEEDLVMFEVPETAVFCIKDGKKIIVAPFMYSDPDKVRLFILGSCMGAVLVQRKHLPLHGSAIAIDGKAYALVGDRGAGKSTLASAFLSNGFYLLSDDIIAVSFSEDKTPFVTPGFPQQKLWKDSLEELGMEKRNFRPLFKREEKFSVPVSTQFFDQPLPLAGIFELIKTNREKVEIQRIKGINQLRTLSYHTFRRSLIHNYNLTQWHFNFTVQIGQKVDMYQLQRPLIGFTAHQLVHLILKTIK
jgi:hypothetical protein